MKGVNPKLKLYCPVWYSRILRTKAENIFKFRDFDKSSNGGTSIRSGSYCIMGELYNWSFEYRDKDYKICDMCYRFGSHLMNHAYPERTVEFRSDINQLVDHIEKDHPEIVRRCVPV
jgi:hypothetical protein